LPISKNNSKEFCFKAKLLELESNEKHRSQANYPK